MMADTLPGALGAVHLDAENPWPGLAAYDEAAAEFFCGRESEAEELLRLIQSSPLTALYGKSGLGKSSLLQAGLFPLLRAQHFLPIYLRLDFSEQSKASPLEQIAQRFREEIDRVGADCPQQANDEVLWEFLHREDFEIWSKDNFLCVPVFVFDQFEELFLHSRGNTERIQRIFDDLTDLIENRIPAELASDDAKSKRDRLNLLSHTYRIVLSFREDYLADVKTLEPKVPSLLRNYLRLDEMNRERAIEVVERAGRAIVEPGVAPLIVDFVGGYSVATETFAQDKAIIEPVLLSLFCYQLNRRRGAKIDKALVMASGQDILDSFYHEALDDEDVKSPPEVCVFIEDYLVQGERYRGSYPKIEALNEGFISEKQLNTLTNRHRLLRVVPYADAARIELIHDCLVSVVCKARDQRHLRKQQAEMEREVREKEKDAYNRQLLWWRRCLFMALLVALIASVFALKERYKATQRAMALAAVGASYQTFGKKQQLSTQLALHSMSFAGLSEDDYLIERAESALRRALNHRLEFELKFEDKPKSVKFSHDGGYLYTAIGKGLKKWDAQTGNELPFHPPEFPASIQQLVLSPDGEKLIVGDEQGNIRLLNPQNGDEITPTPMRHGEGLSAMAVSDNDLLVTANAKDDKVIFWNTLTGDKLALLPVEPDRGQRWISELAFQPKGNHLAVGELSLGKTSVWEIIKAASGELRFKKLYTLANWKGRREQASANTRMLIDSLVFSAVDNEPLLITGDRFNTVNLWDARTGNHLSSLIGHADQIAKVAISPDAKYLASGSSDGMIKIWDIGYSFNLLYTLTGHSLPVQDLAFSPDGNQLVSAGKDKKIMVWNVATHSDAVFAIAFNSDGTRFATGSGDNTIKVWETATRKLIATLPGHEDRITSVAFSPDSNFLASTSYDKTTRIWDLTSKREAMAPLRYAPHDKFYKVAYSRNGRWLATAGANHAVVVWDTASSTPIFEGLHDDQVKDVTFSPDSQKLYSVSIDGTLKVWDVLLRKEITSKQSSNQQKFLSVDCRGSADCDELVFATGSPRILFLSVESGEFSELPDNDLVIENAKFTPDGKKLLLFGHHNEVVIREMTDTDNVNAVRMIGIHTGKVNDVAVSADGQWLATASQDGTFNVSPFEIEYLVAMGCARVSHKNLTDEECQSFLGIQECPSPAPCSPQTGK